MKHLRIVLLFAILLASGSVQAQTIDTLYTGYHLPDIDSIAIDENDGYLQIIVWHHGITQDDGIEWFGGIGGWLILAFIAALILILGTKVTSTVYWLAREDDSD